MVKRYNMPTFFTPGKELSNENAMHLNQTQQYSPYKVAMQDSIMVS